MIAEAVAGGMTIAEVAKQFGVCIATVHIACKDHDLTPRKRRSARRSMLSRDTIMAFVDYRPETGCWIWKGAKSNGYGVHEFGLMHRVSYGWFKGAIPRDLLCLHHCDTPSCINPDHLYAGMPSDNSHDALYRERLSQAKLTETQIGEIKRRLLVGGKAIIPLIAKQFDVDSSLIDRIMRGKVWDHIPALPVSGIAKEHSALVIQQSSASEVA